MTLPPLPEHPRVSIVIPCRNEAGYITRCLASLEGATLDREKTTVLVCDGMSDDGTRQEVEGFTQRLPWMVMLDNTARTTPQALNLGLRYTPFDVGIILGAHAEVEPDFVVRNLAALAVDRTAGCSGGVITNVYGDSTSRRIGAAMGHPFGVGNAHFRTGMRSGHVDTVAFGAYRREVFERIGWFNEQLVRNQDDEFNYRVTGAGFKIQLDPTIRSRYHVRASYSKLFRQYRQYGYWKVYVNRLHGAITTVRQLVPAAWVAFLLAGALLSPLTDIFRWAFIGGLALYLTASIACAWSTSKDMRDIPGIVLAFVVLHSAYGVGYWQGILRFVVLRGRPAESSTRTSR
ncbi:MAG: glycosyltransferase family 2 protein [Flavobacteriales bacterium]